MSSKSVPQLAYLVSKTPKEGLLLPYEDSVANDVKSFEPVAVKIKNGAAHMVLRIGDVLLYVETQVGEMCAPAKVWVLSKASSAQQRLQVVLDPLATQASCYLSPVVAKVVDGVLHVQGTVGDATFRIQARASESWAMVAAKASNTYAAAYQAGESRVRPVWLRSSSQIVSTKELMLSTAQPYWIRGKDGCLYVQSVVGNTLVRVKVSTHERIFAPALLAYERMHGTISSYTAEILAKVVSIHDHVKAQFLQTLAPYLGKAQSMAAYTNVVVNDLVVGVKVRVATKCDSAQQYLSVCYVKVKEGFVYVRGMVGNKVVYVKVSLAEILRSLTAKALEINTDAKACLLAAKDRILVSALSAAQVAKTKSGELSSTVSMVVTDRNMQVTAVGAVGGATTMGVSGGATGLATGSVIGAACGVVPAIFTFGLSIPIGAALGGAAGLCAGALGGGAVGLVGGGAAARSVHKHRDEIKGGAVGALSKANGCKDYMTQKAKNCTGSVVLTTSGYKDYLAEKAKGYSDSVVETTMNVKSRLVGGTGGTVPSDSE